MSCGFKLEDITIIIKTFQRQYALDRLIESIRKCYPKQAVVVCDDSMHKYANKIKMKYSDMNIDVVELPFDSGLSMGRNAALSLVKTKLFLLCDDDFVFDKRTNLDRALEYMNTRQVDILGGCCYNYFPRNSKVLSLIRNFQELTHLEQKKSLVGYFEKHDRVLYEEVFTNDKNDYRESDIVLNFFIGNTSKIRNLGGWNDILKLSEHGEFFIRMKDNGIKVANSSAWGVMHKPELGEDYKEARSRNYEVDAFNILGIDLWIQKLDTGRMLISKRMPNNEISVTKEYEKSIKGYIRKLYDKSL